MKPTNFSKYTQKTDGAHDGEYNYLHILPTVWGDNTKGLISCWELSFRDTLKVIFTRRVYVQVLGDKQPAMKLSVNGADVLVPQTEAYFQAEELREKREQLTTNGKG